MKEIKVTDKEKIIEMIEKEIKIYTTLIETFSDKSSAHYYEILTKRNDCGDLLVKIFKLE